MPILYWFCVTLCALLSVFLPILANIDVKSCSPIPVSSWCNTGDSKALLVGAQSGGGRHWGNCSLCGSISISKQLDSFWGGNCSLAHLLVCQWVWMGVWLLTGWNQGDIGQSCYINMRNCRAVNLIKKETFHYRRTAVEQQTVEIYERCSTFWACRNLEVGRLMKLRKQHQKLELSGT